MFIVLIKTIIEFNKIKRKKIKKEKHLCKFFFLKEVKKIND